MTKVGDAWQGWRSAYDPSQPRDERGRWTESGMTPEEEAAYDSLHDTDRNRKPPDNKGAMAIIKRNKNISDWMGRGYNPVIDEREGDPTRRPGAKFIDQPINDSQSYHNLGVLLHEHEMAKKQFGVKSPQAKRTYKAWTDYSNKRYNDAVRAGRR